MMYQTNYNRFIRPLVEREVICDSITPNLSVDIKRAVETGLVSNIATQPTYGEKELSESSISGHYVDDPLDVLNHGIASQNKPIGGTDTVVDPTST